MNPEELIYSDLSAFTVIPVEAYEQGHIMLLFL